jgi:hypothetical protein
MNVIKPHVSLDVSNADAPIAFYEQVDKGTDTKAGSGCG